MTPVTHEHYHNRGVCGHFNPYELQSPRDVGTIVLVALGGHGHLSNLQTG